MVLTFNYKEIKWDQDIVGCEYVIVNLLFVRVVFGSHCFGFIKNCLRNKMEDDFLMDSMILYIEKEIAAKFGTESIIDDFQDLKERRVPF